MRRMGSPALTRIRRARSPQPSSRIVGATPGSNFGILRRVLLYMFGVLKGRDAQKKWQTGLWRASIPESQDVTAVKMEKYEV